MPKRSAALLLYRLTDEAGLELLIAHMGGPFWANKEARGWSIPKGEYEDGEDSLDAALREFHEEMGSPAPRGEMTALGECRQPSGKIITTYAIEGDFDLAQFRSNTFEMEWPKGSGKVQEFPEVDRAAWVPFDRAGELLLKGHVPIITALRDRLVTQGVRVDVIAGPATEDARDALF
ncbi:MAG TPA: NUDIX domain-containing protein [Spirillospora sp.]|nr:NUDIX domain-containing protein [Spirillospora sp.]